MTSYNQILYNYSIVQNKIEDGELVEQIITPLWIYSEKINPSQSNFSLFPLPPYNWRKSNLDILTPLIQKHDSIPDVPSQQLLPESSLQSYHSYTFLEEFRYMKRSTFTNFFIENMIDVPICFKKSHSLKTKNFELLTLKFSNLLMRQGKSEKTIRQVFTGLRALTNKLKVGKVALYDDRLNWLELYYTINSFFYYNNTEKDHNQIYNFNYQKELYTLSHHCLTGEEMFIDTKHFLKNFLLSFLTKITPVFSYFIYSVDKNIRKFSRGKSGKYTFLWKYVASYKRPHLALRLVARDIRFYESRKFNERLIKIWKDLLLTPEQSFIWKSKTFSHNYVFKNFRKSLMSSLRTTL